MHAAAISKVENSAQGSSCKLKFVHHMTDGQTDRHIAGRMDIEMDKRMERQTDRQIGRQMGRQIDRWTVGESDIQTNSDRK